MEILLNNFKNLIIKIKHIIPRPSLVVVINTNYLIMVVDFLSI